MFPIVLLEVFSSVFYGVTYLELALDTLTLVYLILEVICDIKLAAPPLFLLTDFSLWVEDVTAADMIELPPQPLL